MGLPDDALQMPPLLPITVRATRHADRLGFVLGPGVRVVVSHSSESMSTAVLLASRIGEVCDALVAVHHDDGGGPGAVVLRLAEPDALGLPPDLPEEITREAYRLEVRPHGVMLQAVRPAGLMRGAATLLQLGRTPETQDPGAPPLVVVPAVSIVDHPRHVWRGVALTLGPSEEDLDTALRTLERMAELKLNVLQLRVDGSTALAAYQAVVHHANARCIDVVPELGPEAAPELLEAFVASTPGPCGHVGGDAPGEDVGAATVMQLRDVGMLDRLEEVRGAVAEGARVVVCTGMLTAGGAAGPEAGTTPMARVRALQQADPEGLLGVPTSALLGMATSMQPDDGTSPFCEGPDQDVADDVAAHLAALAELGWSGPGRSDWDSFSVRLGRLSGRIGRAPALAVRW